VPQQHWPEDRESRDYIIQNWAEDTGDARQELVFIGIGMDEPQLRLKLNSALLTDEEMQAGSDSWATLHDPFQPWFN
jgi:hypothetical protein